MKLEFSSNDTNEKYEYTCTLLFSLTVCEKLNEENIKDLLVEFEERIKDSIDPLEYKGKFTVDGLLGV